MSPIQLVLVLLSGLGVLHGVLFSSFLWFYSKANTVANRILSLLLLVLSFRIGKSVILEFVSGPHYTLIFIGLSALLLVGPLFYLYTKSVLLPAFRITKRDLFHLFPFVPAVALSLWFNLETVKSTPLAVFIILFCGYYGHYLLYLVLSYLMIIQAKRNPANNPRATEWLSALAFALAAIWIVYVLNLVEDKIPYIIGPILYSIIAYAITFLAIKKGYIGLLAHKKYQTTPLSAIDIDKVFERLQELIISDELYKDPELSLGTLSKLIHVSPQKISMAINIKFQSNFNGFINHYRIQQAQKLFKDEQFKSYSIAAIAYEIGFNSLTSFNTAFKKEMNVTPSVYRKDIIVS